MPSGSLCRSTHQLIGWIYVAGGAGRRAGRDLSVRDRHWHDQLGIGFHPGEALYVGNASDSNAYVYRLDLSNTGTTPVAQQVSNVPIPRSTVTLLGVTYPGVPGCDGLSGAPYQAILNNPTSIFFVITMPPDRSVVIWTAVDSAGVRHMYGVDADGRKVFQFDAPSGVLLALSIDAGYAQDGQNFCFTATSSTDTYLYCSPFPTSTASPVPGPTLWADLKNSEYGTVTLVGPINSGAELVFSSVVNSVQTVAKISGPGGPVTTLGTTPAVMFNLFTDANGTYLYGAYNNESHTTVSTWVGHSAGRARSRLCQSPTPPFSWAATTTSLRVASKVATSGKAGRTRKNGRPPFRGSVDRLTALSAFSHVLPASRACFPRIGP